jgi:hypothetical protein
MASSLYERIGREKTVRLFSSIVVGSHYEQCGKTEEHMDNKPGMITTLYESDKSPSVLSLYEQYIRHKTILWLALLNMGMISIPVIPFVPKILILLGSIIMGYSSKRDHRNHIPIVLKRIQWDITEKNRLILETSNKKRINVNMRDVIMDHEAFFKVYMPFGNFFWKSFLFNKSNMSSPNELKFMVVPLGKDMRQESEHLEFNEDGEVIRYVYTIRDNDNEKLNALRNQIEKIRDDLKSEQ